MEEYSAKLTGEPFLYNETKIIAKYLFEGENLESLRKRNVKENLIMYKKSSAISRVNSAIFRRLAIFDEKMLDSFVNSDIETSKYILVYAIMKTDKLVNDFIFDVYRDKLIVQNYYIEKFDINNWFEEKCMVSNLKDRTDSTKSKLKQVILKILQDSGMVIKEKNRFKIIKPLLSPDFISILKHNDDLNYVEAFGGIV